MEGHVYVHTAATESNDYFFGFVAVELEIIDLGLKIYVVELDTSRVFVAAGMMTCISSAYLQS